MIINLLRAVFVRLRAHPRLALAWPRYGAIALAVTVVLNAQPKSHLEVLRGFFGRSHPLGVMLRGVLYELDPTSVQLSFLHALRARGPLTLRERTYMYDETNGPSPTPLDEEYAARYLAQLYQFIDSV